MLWWRPITDSWKQIKFPGKNVGKTVSIIEKKTSPTGTYNPVYEKKTKSTTTTTKMFFIPGPSSHPVIMLILEKQKDGHLMIMGRKNIYFFVTDIFWGTIMSTHDILCFYVVNGKLSLNEPPHDKTNKVACAPSEDSDQPGHPPSLIRVFTVRRKKAWVLSYPLSAQRSLWSDWADVQADLSLRWAHSHFVGFDTMRLKLSSNTHLIYFL